MTLPSLFSTLRGEVKATVPFSPKNAGWEKRAQVQPSTGKPDQKEPYQMQYGENMKGMGLPEEVPPGFREQSLGYMHQVQKVSEKLMVCFAQGLGLVDDLFTKFHDVSKPNIQTVLRALHCFALDPTSPVPDGHCRAGTHVDWDLLTLLFQKLGQSGLEIRPGRGVLTAFGARDTWTKIEPVAGEIVCNM